MPRHAVLCMLCPHRYVRWAQLLVDKAPQGTGPSSCNTVVLELGMEGVAAPLECDISPRRIAIPGMLTPGEQVGMGVWAWLTTNTTWLPIANPCMPP